MFVGGGYEDIATPPESLDPIGIKYYVYILNKLQVSGVLTDLDKPILTQTAECLSLMDQATKQLHYQGIVQKQVDKNGNITYKENPAVGIHNKYLTQFNKLGSQLGMSPSSRAQITAVNIDQAMQDNDPIKQILNS